MAREKNKTKRSGVTFKVADVDSYPDELLPERNQFEVAEEIIGEKCEAVSDYDSKVIHSAALHPLVAAALFAFCDHRPLVLGPDVMWCVVLQGLANHIRRDPDSFRHHFVSHEGKKTIKVRRDDFVPGDPDNPWSEVFGQFSEQIKEHIGESTHRLIVCDFNTTTPTARAVSEVSLIDCVQHYFDYLLMTLCGIPEVSLLGEEADWIHFKEKLARLNDAFDLDWWLGKLLPVADQFINASRDSADPSFWNSIFKYDGMSGGPYFNGWLLDFFPYLKNPSTNEVDVLNPNLASNNYDPTYSRLGITGSTLPVAVCQAPFTWEFDGRAHPYLLYGGLIGVEQDQQTMALMPKLGWAVRANQRAGLSRYGHLDKAHIVSNLHSNFQTREETLKRYRLNDEELDELLVEFTDGLADTEKCLTYCQSFYDWLLHSDDTTRDDDTACDDDSSFHQSVIRINTVAAQKLKKYCDFGEPGAWNELEEQLISIGALHSDVERLKEVSNEAIDEAAIESVVNLTLNLVPRLADVQRIFRTMMKIAGGSKLVDEFDSWEKQLGIT